MLSYTLDTDRVKYIRKVAGALDFISSAVAVTMKVWTSPHNQNILVDLLVWVMTRMWESYNGQETKISFVMDRRN